MFVLWGLCVDHWQSMTFPYSCGQTGTSFDSHDVGGQAPLVARSLSVSANVYWGAEALFLGHGKQIVGPFANEKTKKKKEKGVKWRRAGSGERCLAGQGDWDYTPMIFSSSQRKWRGSTREEKTNQCTWEKFTISRPVSDAADCWCLTGCCNRMLTRNKYGD